MAIIEIETVSATVEYDENDTRTPDLTVKVREVMNILEAEDICDNALDTVLPKDI